MGKNFCTVKVTDDTLEFLKKIPMNRVRINLEEEKLISITESLSLIERYFKLNNNRYMELIKMIYENGNK